MDRHAEMGIGVLDRFEGRGSGHLDPRGIAEHAVQRVFVGFSGSLFFNGKSPETTQEALVGTPDNQDPTRFPANHCCNHLLVWDGSRNGLYRKTFLET